MLRGAAPQSSSPRSPRCSTLNSSLGGIWKNKAVVPAWLPLNFVESSPQDTGWACLESFAVKAFALGSGLQWDVRVEAS